MDGYNFAKHLLDTFQAAPDTVKLAIVLSVPLLLLGLVALALHHLRLVRRTEREWRIEIDQHREDMKRWAEALEADLRWRRLDPLAGPPPLPKPLSETHRRQLLGKRPKDEEEKD